MVRCAACSSSAVAVMLTPSAVSDDLVLKRIEHELLEQVPETTRALYRYIRRFQHENGYAPSVRDMQAEMGWGSTSNVAHHLKQLEGVGLIEREYAAARAIRLPHAA